MASAVCGPRIDALGKKLAELRGRKDELAAAMDFERVTPPTEPELDEIRAHIRSAVNDGPAPQRQALLRALVEEVRVKGRDAIYPIFRVPNGEVRTLSGLVLLGWLKVGGSRSNSTSALDIRRLTPFLGNVPLKAITPGMIQSTYTTMLKAGPSTVVLSGDPVMVGSSRPRWRSPESLG